MKVLLILFSLTVLATPVFGKGAGTDIGIGLGQFSLSGDQAKGSGTGTIVRTMSLMGGDGFQGGIGVEVGFGSIENEGEECCFPKDETISIDNFGINSSILWGLGASFLAGFEIGIHSFDLAQDENKSNYGFTKLALVGRFAFTERWSTTANYSYFLPIEEGTEDNTYKLGATIAYLAVSYFIVPE